MSKNNVSALTTPFAADIDKSCPWNVYPRPQLKRNSFLCLNGYWDFHVGKHFSFPTEYSEKILVPFPPESLLSEIGRKIESDDVLIYRRRFTVPADFIKKRVFIRFGAVDSFTRVYINGKEIGSHRFGYLPFFSDVTNLISVGENEIRLMVTDDLSDKYPYGKQKKKRGGMWYTPTSGIWQTVWLESVPDNYIESIRMTPNTKSVKINVVTKTPCKKKLTLNDSGQTFEFETDEIIIQPEKIECWSPENPYLYRFTLTTETDEVESYFALREISCGKFNGKPRLFLNSSPYLFNGLLDQGYYPDGIFLPATPQGYEYDIKTAKSLGFNTIRKHIKIEPEIFYYLCDTLGIVVFQDIVNNGKYSFFSDTLLPTLNFKKKDDKLLHNDAQTRENFELSMRATANLLYNHPSVLYYTIFNEGWGQFDSDRLYAELRDLDPTRVIDSTSGWFWQKDSDVDSHHVYFRKPKLSVGDERPLVLSEFGGYSHRVDGHLYGRKNYGYKTFKRQSVFEDAVCDLYTNGIMPLVQDGISALIYTQLSDVEDETNGFLTYDRKIIKVNADRLYRIAQQMYSKSNYTTENET